MRILRRFYSNATVKMARPVNLAPGDEAYFGYTFEYQVPESYLAEVSHAMVTSRGIIYRFFKTLRRFIICYRQDFHAYRFRYLFHVLLRHRPLFLDSGTDYMLVFDNYSGPAGFSHWLSDGLTRLVEVNSLLKDHTILIPEYFEKEKVYMETLALFDVGKTQVIPSNRYAYLPRVRVPTHIAASGDFLPENVRKLRDHVWRRLNLDAIAPRGDRVYISRAKATRRYVKNEEQVRSLLENAGFITVYMEEYSFAKQVELVYHAAVVVSIHGAALTHVHFMRKGTSVLEFRNEHDAVNCHFQRLASAADVNYFYLRCKAEEVAKAANNYNLDVALPELESVLNSIANLK
jgi:capsular polysaccharide biosynthesis protein